MSVHIVIIAGIFAAALCIGGLIMALAEIDNDVISLWFGAGGLVILIAVTVLGLQSLTDEHDLQHNSDILVCRIETVKTLKEVGALKEVVELPENVTDEKLQEIANRYGYILARTCP